MDEAAPRSPCTIRTNNGDEQCMIKWKKMQGFIEISATHQILFPLSLTVKHGSRLTRNSAIIVREIERGEAAKRIWRVNGREAEVRGRGVVCRWAV
jgi:hypothetical protein